MAIFTHESIVEHPARDVFRWHLEPGALERLTPPWESIRVVERQGTVRDGGLVVLSLKKGPARIRWQARHTAYEEGSLFRDEQISGPFSRWIHTHRFEPVGEGRCRMVDEVDWQPPLGSLGETFGSGFIRETLRRLFVFRHQRLSQDLFRHRSAPGGLLRVAVTGSTGLVGRDLAHFLSAGGHEVIPIVRSPRREGPPAVRWDPEAEILDAEALEGVDAVVHLAGESISGARWTAEKKRAIKNSRVKGTELLARSLASLRTPPSVLVVASAVGLYGDRGDQIVTEESKPGRGFLAEVCQAWEAAAAPAVRAGIRVVHPRIGVVLSPGGGALRSMLLPYSLGLGGRQGSGKQYVSWIDLDDLVGLIHHAIRTRGLSGPVNATSPHPVPNATFATTLGRVLRRPSLLPMPAPAVRALFGEMGQALLLEGARVLPERAQATGFSFLLAGLEESLRFQLGRTETPEHP